MYTGFITKISGLRKHTNADRLLCGECFGNTVIVSTDYTEGQIGVYFPTDGKLGVEYAEKNNLLRKKDENGNSVGGYLDPDKRNITAIKLRGEKSDGLFMPLSSLSDFTDITKLKVGDTISVLNGVVICEKYIPRANTPRTRISSGKKKGKKNGVKITYPLFAEHKDTEQLAYNLHSFKEGDLCYITLKMHGTSQRTAYTLKQTNKKQGLFAKLLKKFGFERKPYEVVSGTRRVTINNFDKNSGYCGNDSFRKPYHDYFSTKLHKGEEIFYEVLGYTDTGALIMGECSNKKTNDKEFIKQYGETTKFTYGCDGKAVKNRVFVYRMTMTNEDGHVVEYSTDLCKRRCEEMGVDFVPIFDRFLFTTKEDLLERVGKFVDGADPIGLSHIREGVVVRRDSLPTFVAYKSKSFAFKVLEGIVKSDADAPDMEEAQEVEI